MCFGGQSIATFSWDADVYAALRQFHRAKGFDPDSQDVAQDLGYPLFQLPSAMNPLFAHVQVDAADSESQVDNQEPVDIDADGGNNVHESTSASGEPGPPSLRDEMSISQTFKFFMNVQGMLFLFLFYLGYRQTAEDARNSPNNIQCQNPDPKNARIRKICILNGSHAGCRRSSIW
ncbi:hypothetical protein B0H13DRAFT_2549772 [Mycena leptocephala]|nr:hypothetical protein B0H13DRAFT_2549772 [Mycena leptocephala]